MLLGKRKNNQLLSFIKPIPKRLKYLEYYEILDIENKLKKQIIKYKYSKLNFTLKDKDRINPYFLDFY